MAARKGLSDEERREERIRRHNRELDAVTLPDVSAMINRIWEARPLHPTNWRFLVCAARACLERLEEPTITPEQTLRAAGITGKRQAAYQRKLSTLLSGRQREGA
jgi:DNA-binding transcriptional LysR family regulator